jgi:hypothetical protein
VQCYDLLAIWCEGNPVNNKKMEKHIPFFFSQAGLGVEPTILLTNVLEGEPHLVASIKSL